MSLEIKLAFTQNWMLEFGRQNVKRLELIKAYMSESSL